MGRALKRHVQQSIRFPDKNGQWRGGQHKRSGRPPSGPRSSERHKTRPAVKASSPVHVVLRVSRAIGKLRRGRMYLALRRALVTTFALDDFRIVHISIQSNHVHLLVEAGDRMILARGMQGFQISAAKHMNAAVGLEDGKRRRGSVFTDRYHAESISSPRHARHALAYILNNWRHHAEDRRGDARVWVLDPFSSADRFEGWKDLDDPITPVFRKTYEAMPVWEPRSWLLVEGWRRHGLVDPREVPGAKASPTGSPMAE